MWLESFKGTLVNLNNTFNIVQSKVADGKDASGNTKYQYTVVAYGNSPSSRLTLFKTPTEADRNTVLSNIKDALNSATTVNETTVISPYYDLENTSGATSEARPYNPDLSA